MKLTKKKAIEITIELWGWLAETGEWKSEWDGWGKYGRMNCHCPLCEYMERHGGKCGVCPLLTELGTGCYRLGYREWENADKNEDVEARKKYAKLFLEELRKL